MTPDTIGRLRDILRSTFCCDNEFVQSVSVSEEYKGRSLWSGRVGIFRLLGVEMGECYGWEADCQLGLSQPVIVPRTAQVNSPAAAVRAYILGLCDDCTADSDAAMETAGLPG